MRSGRRSRRAGSGRARPPRSRRRSAARAAPPRARPSLSRWASGSSSSSTSGCCSRQAASAISLRCPPERLRVGSDSSSGREPELEQGGARPPRGARPAGSLEALERLLLAGEHPRHPVEVGDHLGAPELRRELGQLPLELDEIGPRVEHGLERGPVVTGRVLVEIGDPRAAAARHLAAVGSLEAGEDLQQRRLAAAVRADDADPRLRLDRQVGAVEDEARAERLRDRRGRREASRRQGGSPAGTPDGGCREPGDAGKLPCHARNLPLPLKGARRRADRHHMRRVLALIATTCVALGLTGVAAAVQPPTPPAPAAAKATSWADPQIRIVTAAGMLGDDLATFRPSDPLDAGRAGRRSRRVGQACRDAGRPVEARHDERARRPARRRARA